MTDEFGPRQPTAAQAEAAASFVARQQAVLEANRAARRLYAVAPSESLRCFTPPELEAHDDAVRLAAIRDYEEKRKQDGTEKTSRSGA